MTGDVATAARKAKLAKAQARLRAEHAAGVHRNLSLTACPLCTP